jgi:DMSO/TMAO reductase YedYZ heme-binding membrane subunit
VRDLYLGFGDVYAKLDEDQRKACILGMILLIIMIPLVAGTSFVIQGNGKAPVVPLPNVYRV